jgi:uncharacterized membrane-anchored protein YhcB (DUF1043 family)
MAKGSGLASLVTGIALGAAALFLSDEKNRTKVKGQLSKVTADVKTVSKEWQEDPDKAIDLLKKKAAAIAKDLEKSSKDAGKKLSETSKMKMLDALEETEKMIKSARASLKPEPKK